MANLKLVINSDKQVTFGSGVKVREVYSNTITERMNQLSASLGNIVTGSSNFRGSYTTAQRNMLNTTGYNIGDWVYDKDLNSPYFWNGTEWT